MTRILFLGDTHGDLDFAIRALDKAYDLRCDAVFQVGDFGFLWPGIGSGAYDALEAHTQALDLPLFWIDGNHDWHPRIRERFLPEDFTISRSTHVPHIGGVHHIRRGKSLTVIGEGLSTMKIVGLGGAPSIDRRSRVENVSWWPEELITVGDVAGITCGDADVLASHDAPVMPPGFGPIGRPDFDRTSAVNAGLVGQARFRSGAELVVHGHWHKRYSRLHGSYAIEGLDCNTGKFSSSYLLFEKHEDGQRTWESAK